MFGLPFCLLRDSCFIRNPFSYPRRLRKALPCRARRFDLQLRLGMGSLPGVLGTTLVAANARQYSPGNECRKLANQIPRHYTNSPRTKQAVPGFHEVCSRRDKNNQFEPWLLPSPPLHKRSRWVPVNLDARTMRDSETQTQPGHEFEPLKPCICMPNLRVIPEAIPLPGAWRVL